VAAPAEESPSGVAIPPGAAAEPPADTRAVAPRVRRRKSAFAAARDSGAE
jgi:hypothetical protein